ncbi:MAG: hypothetical protein RIC35_10420 [Marinoscillum sp.]
MKKVDALSYTMTTTTRKEKDLGSKETVEESEIDQIQVVFFGKLSAQSQNSLDYAK